MQEVSLISHIISFPNLYAIVMSNFRNSEALLGAVTIFDKLKNFLGGGHNSVWVKIRDIFVQGWGSTRTAISEKMFGVTPERIRGIIRTPDVTESKLIDAIEHKQNPPTRLKEDIS